MHSPQTAVEMIPAVGQDVYLKSGSLLVQCKVVDVKNSWGKVRLLITPNLGSGQQWVEMSSIKTSGLPSWIQERIA